MKEKGSKVVLYVPSDTPEAMVLATKKIAGVPLIVRGIMTLAMSEVTEITLLIAGSQKKRIEKFLEKYRGERLPQINYVFYDESYGVSPETIAELEKNVSDRFSLINSNLLFEKSLLDLMKNTPMKDNEMILCKEGAHPIPFYEFTKEALDKLKVLTRDKPRSIESCIGFIFKQSKNPFIASKPSLVNSFLVKRFRDVVVAEKYLAESIRLLTGGWIAKNINKRFSLGPSMLMAKIWISPHAITMFNILIGLMSGVFAAGKGYFPMFIGALLFQIASIADGCDGEVAKLTFRQSKFGQYIDTISDNLTLASFLIGITIGSYHTLNTKLVLFAGLFSVVGAGIMIWIMMRYLREHSNSASLVAFDKEFIQNIKEEPVYMIWFIKNFKFFIKKDCFSFIIFCLGISGLLVWWPFISALGTTTGAVILTYLLPPFKKTKKKEKQPILSSAQVARIVESQWRI